MRLKNKIAEMDNERKKIFLARELEQYKLQIEDMMIRADYIVEKLDKEDSKEFQEKVVQKLKDILTGDYDFNGIADKIRGYKNKK